MIYYWLRRAYVHASLAIIINSRQSNETSDSNITLWSEIARNSQGRRHQHTGCTSNIVRRLFSPVTTVGVVNVVMAMYLVTVMAVMMIGASIGIMLGVAMIVISIAITVFTSLSPPWQQMFTCVR